MSKEKEGRVRRIKVPITIAMHESIKVLANQSDPPATQGDVAFDLLEVGFEELFKLNNKQKGGDESMSSNSVVINGNIHYEVPDAKMNAVVAVLDAVSSGAMGIPSEAKRSAEAEQADSPVEAAEDHGDAALPGSDDPGLAEPVETCSDEKPQAETDEPPIEGSEIADPNEI